jgi:hypothetical protein
VPLMAGSGCAPHTTTSGWLGEVGATQFVGGPPRSKDSLVQMSQPVVRPLSNQGAFGSIHYATPSARFQMRTGLKCGTPIRTASSVAGG